MNLMTLLQQQLGPMTYPLTLCAALSSIVLLERLSVFLHATFTGKLRRDGLVLLQEHSDHPKEARQEIASIWLQHRQRQLASGIRLLQVIALLAPLLGLLGTVIGLIDVFDNLEQQQGPVEPAMLAGGLGIAIRCSSIDFRPNSSKFNSPPSCSLARRNARSA